MPADRVLTCPRCSTVIDVAPVAMPLINESNGEPTGAVLKRCPACRAWSWMTLERQPA
jgi:uncharacterized C2H2 Zn-finger protein